jgi:hypothetical protein
MLTVIENGKKPLTSCILTDLIVYCSKSEDEIKAHVNVCFFEGGFGRGVPLGKKKSVDATPSLEASNATSSSIPPSDEVMKPDGTPGKKFFEVCKIGKLEMLKELLDGVDKSKFNINGTDFWKRTPLHVCSREGHADCVKLILDNGGHVATIDKDKDTPLHFACAAGHQFIVRQLIEAGSDVNAVSGRGWTPLFDCVTKDSRDCALMLVTAGAKVDITERYFQHTPLHIAAKV